MESVIKLCKYNLPREEYILVEKLINENILKGSFLTASCRNSISDFIITHLFLYEVFDNQIFIRSCIISKFLNNPKYCTLLLSIIIKKVFPDIPYDNVITIYGCEYKNANNIKLIEGEEILEDELIIKKFPWELEKDKYRFYRIDYKYQNVEDFYEK